MLRAAGVRESDISDFLAQQARRGDGQVHDCAGSRRPRRRRDGAVRGVPVARGLGHRIEQLDDAATTTDADVARMLVERFGEDALERVAEILLETA
jgi:hypothetical protein